MKITRVKRYARKDLKANPGNIYVFGDNVERIGIGGQAKACRDEPNAHGIATLWAPGKPYTEADDAEALRIMGDDLASLKRKAESTGSTIVWPSDGVGTGLARMPKEMRRTFDGMIRDIFGIENELS